jgi:hypothetical protein
VARTAAGTGRAQSGRQNTGWTCRNRVATPPVTKLVRSTPRTGGVPFSPRAIPPWLHGTTFGWLLWSKWPSWPFTPLVAMLPRAPGIAFGSQVDTWYLPSGTLGCRLTHSGPIHRVDFAESSFSLSGIGGQRPIGVWKRRFGDNLNDVVGLAESAPFAPITGRVRILYRGAKASG